MQINTIYILGNIWVTKFTAKFIIITNNIKGRNKMWMITFTGGYTFIVSLFCWFVNRLFIFFLIRKTKVWVDSRIQLNCWKHYYSIFDLRPIKEHTIWHLFDCSWLIHEMLSMSIFLTYIVTKALRNCSIVSFWWHMEKKQ